jgi:hypothetical protein
MVLYRVLNADFESVPVKPFGTLYEAKQHILSLLETYKGPFHIMELQIMFTQER